jgi:hypothetical protein
MGKMLQSNILAESTKRKAKSLLLQGLALSF